MPTTAALAARLVAEDAQVALQTFGGNVEDSAADDRTVALAICLAGDAICSRLAQVAAAIADAEVDHAG